MRMLSVSYLPVDCSSLLVCGAPGMRLSLNKVIYFQYFSEVPFYKSGPKSGPSLQK